MCGCADDREFAAYPMTNDPMTKDLMTNDRIGCADMQMCECADEGGCAAEPAEERYADYLMTNDQMTNGQTRPMTNDVMTNDQKGCADDKSVGLNSVPWEGEKAFTNDTSHSQTSINDKNKAAPA